jgi:hypothetical protein
LLRCLGAALAIAPLVLGAARPAPSSELPGGRVIDLSHAFDADTIFWPTEEAAPTSTRRSTSTPRATRSTRFRSIGSWVRVS